MADWFLERFTKCPTGRIEDETFFEVRLVDDDPRSVKDSTPRTANIVRLYTVGTMPRRQEREIVLVRAAVARVQREVLFVARIAPGDPHLDLDLAGLGLTVTWGDDGEGRARRTMNVWEFIAPVLPGVEPRPGDTIDDLKAARRGERPLIR